MSPCCTSSSLKAPLHVPTHLFTTGTLTLFSSSGRCGTSQSTAGPFGTHHYHTFYTVYTNTVHTSTVGPWDVLHFHTHVFHSADMQHWRVHLLDMKVEICTAGISTTPWNSVAGTGEWPPWWSSFSPHFSTRWGLSYLSWWRWSLVVAPAVPGQYSSTHAASLGLHRHALPGDVHCTSQPRCVCSQDGITVNTFPFIFPSSLMVYSLSFSLFLSPSPPPSLSLTIPQWSEPT